MLIRTEDVAKAMHAAIQWYIGPRDEHEDPVLSSRLHLVLELQSDLIDGATPDWLKPFPTAVLALVLRMCRRLPEEEFKEIADMLDEVYGSL